jgi:hypothetical protein
LLAALNVGDEAGRTLEQHPRSVAIIELHNVNVVNADVQAGAFRLGTRPARKDAGNAHQAILPNQPFDGRRENLSQANSSRGHLLSCSTLSARVLQKIAAISCRCFSVNRRGDTSL